MSNVFLIIKMCYAHNRWYDISCATLYIGYKQELVIGLTNLLRQNSRCSEQSASSYFLVSFSSYSYWTVRRLLYFLQTQFIISFRNCRHFCLCNFITGLPFLKDHYSCTIVLCFLNFHLFLCHSLYYKRHYLPWT